MDYLIGIVLAALVCALGFVVRLDRERAFYSTMLMTIALYYVLFAVMGGETRVLLVEIGVALVFIAIAIAGFKWNPWWVVAGLAAHGLFDFFVHGALYVDRGVPAWWPAFCGAFDVSAALILAALLRRRRGEAPSTAASIGRN